MNYTQIIIEGRITIPEDASKIIELGEFFGYDEQTANALWEETKLQCNKISEDFKFPTTGKIIPKFVKTLQDNPDALVKFMYMGVWVGLIEEYFKSMDSNKPHINFN